MWEMGSGWSGFRLLSSYERMKCEDLKAVKRIMNLDGKKNIRKGIEA